ncbi:transcriptional activator of comK gene [Evansella vedderi]|uniref:Transcriptional activator of comK protein n=1 Tax=Evansella vedderi TaxID=38282 RepID=A0ABT9ZZF1_9BACI|nr:BMP family ABC transporter substrate-binding protein [Evansella vedderi]MDQ0256621.1 transcriptional activator of comK gene [Evansella vedderi]
MQQSRQLRGIIIISTIVAIIFILVMMFKMRDILHSTNEAEDNRTMVAIITSDEVVDQSWGSLAYLGQLKIEEQFPVIVSFSSEKNTEERMEMATMEAIDAGAEVIIGHGREFSGVFTEVAPSYPDIHFVTIHGNSEHPNQSVYTYWQNEMEYFLGLAAALKTETNKVGVLDPIHPREQDPQFEIGLQFYNPDASLYYSTVGSREDGEKAVELFQEMIDNGVDVIYTKGNAYNRDVIEHAKKHGIYVIGYLDDQSYMAENLVLTSMLNDVSQAYVEIMNDFFSEAGIPSGKNILDETHGVYSLAPFGPMFTEEEKEFIQGEMQKFSQGKLTFPETN